VQQLSPCPYTAGKCNHLLKCDILQSRHLSWTNRLAAEAGRGGTGPLRNWWSSVIVAFQACTKWMRFLSTKWGACPETQVFGEGSTQTV
jgi:hypothetical protein